MSYILSASRLMKASEVSALCKQLKENKQVLMQQEFQVKSIISVNKEKAAS